MFKNYLVINIYTAVCKRAITMPQMIIPELRPSFWAQLLLALGFAAEPVAVDEADEADETFVELSGLPPLTAVVAGPLPDPALLTLAAEIVYTWLSPPFVYVNTAPAAGDVTVPARFDNVAVPLAGRLSGLKNVPPATGENPRSEPQGNSVR